MGEPYTRFCINVTRTCFYILDIIKLVNIRFSLLLLSLVSAGPVGRVAGPVAPIHQNRNTEYNFIIAVPLYFLQLLLMIPFIFYWWHSYVIVIYQVGTRAFSS